MTLVSEGADFRRTLAAGAGLALAEPSLASVGDYVALMKPRVMSLVVFTALVGLAVAPGSLHPMIGFTALLCIAAAPSGADGPRAAGRGAGFRADPRKLRRGGARLAGE